MGEKHAGKNRRRKNNGRNSRHQLRLTVARPPCRSRPSLCQKPCSDSVAATLLSSRCICTPAISSCSTVCWPSRCRQPRVSAHQPADRRDGRQPGSLHPASSGCATSSATYLAVNSSLRYLRLYGPGGPRPSRPRGVRRCRSIPTDQPTRNAGSIHMTLTATTSND